MDTFPIAVFIIIRVVKIRLAFISVINQASRRACCKLVCVIFLKFMKISHNLF